MPQPWRVLRRTIPCWLNTAKKSSSLKRAFTSKFVWVQYSMYQELLLWSQKFIWRNSYVPFGNFFYFVGLFFRWKILDEGLPHINNFNNVLELPAEIRFSQSKSAEIDYVKMKTYVYVDNVSTTGYIFYVLRQKSKFETIISVCCLIMYYYYFLLQWYWTQAQGDDWVYWKMEKHWWHEKNLLVEKDNNVR